MTDDNTGPALTDDNTGPALPRPASRREAVVRLAQFLVGLAIAAVLLGWLLPSITQTSWAEIVATVTGIGWQWFLGLVAIMMGGLFLYTFTLKGSLPGLSHGRALLSNLAGSGVSNVLPAGGAFGTALNYAMWRSWGFGHRAITTSMIVTTVWNALIRAVLPVVAAVALIPLPQRLPTAIWGGAWLGGAIGLAAVAVLVAVIASPRSAARVGRWGNALLHRIRPQAEVDVEAAALRLRETTIDVVRRRWHLLTFGVCGFFGVYFVLFWLCLHLSGVQVSGPVAFAGFAVGRLLTAVPVTPGGLGVSEAGAAATLMAMGTDPAATGAGVALFAVFSFVLEIPFGAIALVIWLATRRRGTAG